MSHPFFPTSLRRDPGQPANLAARLDAQLRERLEEAVDFVCLQALVARRRALGLPAPAADSARDREEFRHGVRAFLEHLRGSVPADLTPEQQRKVEVAAQDAGDETARLLAVQVALARVLPDYWQRFEAGWTAWAGALSAGGLGGRPEPPMYSGGERRSLLGRLFGRG
ncbi:MAG: hypothetical protein HYU25_07830 [Candidatus Rokubacteria bacterium]|nr:hypothetical protein [Candidatus Rokubacteria bacterium]